MPKRYLVFKWAVYGLATLALVFLSSLLCLATIPLISLLL